MTTVAIKVVEKRVSCDVSSAKRELRVLTRMGTHPNIVTLRDSYETEDTYCLVMEQLEMTLNRYAWMSAPIPVDTCNDILRQICTGLAWLHHLGYVHTDLKPDNVMITRGPLGLVVKLIDFGCVRVVEDIPHMYPEDGEETAYMTTRWYRSPEVIIGRSRSIGTALDMWAVGCIGYQLYTREVLFPGTNEWDMLTWFEMYLGLPPDAMISDFAREVFYSNDETFAQMTKKNGRAPYSTELFDEYMAMPHARTRLAYLQASAFDDADLDAPAHRLTCWRRRDFLYSQFPDLVNPRALLFPTERPEDEEYANLLYSILQYDPEKRPTAEMVADYLRRVLEPVEG